MNNITGQQLWFVLKLPNGFIPSIAKPKWIFLHSSPNLGNSWSIFFHCIESDGWQMSLSHLLSVACHLRFLASFGFANKRLSMGTIERYQTTFKAYPSFSIWPLSSLFLFCLYRDDPHFGHFFKSSNYLLYNMQSLGHACILLYFIPIVQRIFLAT